MRRVSQCLLTLAICCAAATIGRGDPGDLHSWQINEIYSDPTGTYQFIEMHEVSGLNNQQTLSGSINFPNAKHMVSNENNFTYTTDLPSSLTANKYFLSATPGFASLPGAVTPDFVIPANFFSIHGDTLTFSAFASFTFTDGQLPTDGIHSLWVGNGASVNSPTNFAGQTGSVTIPVPEPSSFCLLACGSVTLLGMWLKRRRELVRLPMLTQPAVGQQAAG